MDPRTTADWLKKRHRAREKGLAGERDVAHAAAAQAAKLLLREFGARRVWLFGSLTWGRFHERSDVDIAVEGLAPARFFEASARVHELFDRPVDLVPVEQVEAPFRARIEKEGEELGVA